MWQFLQLLTSDEREEEINILKDIRNIPILGKIFSNNDARMKEQLAELALLIGGSFLAHSENDVNRFILKHLAKIIVLSADRDFTDIVNLIFGANFICNAAIAAVTNGNAEWLVFLGGSAIFVNSFTRIFGEQDTEYNLQITGDVENEN